MKQTTSASLAYGVMSRQVPAEFGVEGYFFRYERHLVFWKRLANGDISIVTVLHERMHQIERFKGDFEQTIDFTN